MNWTVQEIKKHFGGHLVGTEYMKNMVSLAVSKLPEDIANPIIHNCWFFSSSDDAWGYAFDGNDLKDKKLIFLSDVLFNEPEEQILYTILHEIGHIALNHKNSIRHQQTEQEIVKQEKDADQFA